jgi:predicted nucleotidyltransferase
MDKKSVKKIVDEFHQAIRARGISPSKIILYGSHVSGTHREGNDIDLIVISEDFIGKDYWERIDILTDVIYERFVPIEAVAMTQKEWDQGESFVVDYAQNGEELFAA